MGVYRIKKEKKYACGCVVSRKLPTFVGELFDVRNPAESGNKNGCKVITNAFPKSG